LRQRFPEAFHVLESSLEEADPLEIVYPGNPDEYDDVVLEILVLLAPENVALAQVPSDRITAVVREGLARRFGEEPDEARLRRAAGLISDRGGFLDEGLGA
jgi:hypothetical protein